MHLPILKIERQPGHEVGLEPFLDRAAVSEWLNTSERHLRRPVELHGMPMHRVGREQRFRRGEVLDWLHGDGRRG